VRPRRARRLSTAILPLVGVLIVACRPGLEAPSAGPPARLSELGIFTGPLAELRPAKGLHPYAVRAPLFSDYTAKQRLIRLPAGEAMGYRASGPFDFPVGTLIVKTFSMPHDLRAPKGAARRLETRLLRRDAAGWRAFSYVWGEDQREAQLELAGDIVPVTWRHYDGRERMSRYVVPTVNDCKACHGVDGHIEPIGPRASQLVAAGAATRGSLLTSWARDGLLTGLTEGHDEGALLARWQDDGEPLERRARAYLEGNCAHCHTPRGSANQAGLDLRGSVTDRRALGVGKAPVAAGRGSGGRAYAIVPGRPEASILTFRMASTELGVAMPELGRRLVHDEGVALMETWIRAMPTPR